MTPEQANILLGLTIGFIIYFLGYCAFSYWRHWYKTRNHYKKYEK